MFNYIFPIFCFGLVITGIVFLGIIEASKQVKTESAKEDEPQTRGGNLAPTAPRNGQSPRFTARSINE